MQAKANPPIGAIKILHVLDHSVPVVDGYSIRGENIVRFQAEWGLVPVAVTSARQVDKYNTPAADDVETIHGVRYYRTPSTPESRVPLIPEWQRLRRMTKRIDEVVRKERPDVLHAHSPCLWGLAASRVARRHGIPLVYEIRGFWEDALVDSGKTSETSLRYKLVRALETHVCRSAKIVTTIAHGLRDDLIERGIDGDQIKIAANGVQADRFSALAPDDDLIAELGYEGKTLIGYIGSLFAWEGVDDLIRAVPYIVEQAPNVRVVIVGGGELEPKIRKLMDELQVHDVVNYVGRVPHEDVTRYYSIMDVLVYPRKSTRNTELCTPLKPLEAMAMEKAIVGSDVGGIAELISDGAGLQFTAGEPRHLATQCLDLVDNPEKRNRIGTDAREQILANRQWKNIVAGYLDVYSRAIGQPIVAPQTICAGDDAIAAASIP